MSGYRPSPPPVRTHNLNPPPLRRSHTKENASPTTYSFNPSPVKAYHTHTQHAGQIMYDIPVPVSPNPESSGVMENLISNSNNLDVGAIGSVSAHPLIGNSSSASTLMGNGRTKSTYSASLGGGQERKTGNALAYAQSRSAGPPRMPPRSRRGSRETVERITLSRNDSSVMGNGTGSGVGSGSGSGSGSGVGMYGSAGRETLSASTSGSTLGGGSSPVKMAYDHRTRSNTTTPTPLGSQTRRSTDVSPGPYRDNKPVRSKTGPTPPPRLQTAQVPSRLGSPSPNRQGEMFASGGTGSVMREAREGSLYTVGQQSVAGSYVRREGGGVGSPSPGDLHTFAHHCHLFYFSSNPPSSSQTYIDTTLASLPPSHRAAYTRIQNSLRAQSHSHNARLRLLAFHVLISSTSINGGLSPLVRQEIRSKRARAERKAKLSEFVTRWCTKSAVGVEPFFKALYVCLMLQGKGERGVGGAGGKRVVWEVDDAVFIEAGGKDFMNEAVALIKGVLGFQDVALSSPPRLRRPTLPMLQPRPSFATNATPRSSFSEQPGGHEIESLLPLASGSSTTSTTTGNRTRAPSDPFLDPSRSPDKRSAVPVPLPAGKRGPAPPVPTHKRSASGKGPAPPPPTSRNLQTPTPRLHGSRTPSTGTSDGLLSNPLSPTAESPLLAGRSGGDSDSIIAGLEDAAEREDTLASLGRASREKFALARPSRPAGDARTLSTSEIRGLLDGTSKLDLNAENALDTEDFNEDDEEEDLSTPRLRLWTFPAHMTDGEIDGLLAVFPKHITKAQGMRSTRFPLPRPTSLKALKAHDAEMGIGGDVQDNDGEASWPSILDVKVPPDDAYGVVAPGTGRLWLGELPRDAPWKRGFFERMARWFQGLFGG